MKRHENRHALLMNSNYLDGGARGARTPDLLHAMQALFQLSYGPASWYRAHATRGDRQVPGIAVLGMGRLRLRHAVSDNESGSAVLRFGRGDCTRPLDSRRL